MLILCLDSSGSDLRTAVFNDDNCLAEDSSDSRGNHSHEIINRVDRVLGESGKSLGDIDLFAVNIGPGSFTGLRIGLAAMAGFSLSKNIPLIGNTAFEIASEDMRKISGNYLMLIPCRGNEYYSAHFSCADENVAFIGNPVVIKPDDYRPPFDIVNLIGPGAESFYEKLPSESGNKCVLIDTNTPGLKSQAVLAVRKSAQMDLTHIKIPELFYIAPSQAEVNYARRRAGN